MIPKEVKIALLEAFRNYERFSLSSLLNIYMAYTKPDGVTREREETFQMEQILMSEFGCSYGLKTHWTQKELKKKSIWLGNIGPVTYEIHLNVGDLENHSQEIEEALRMLREQSDSYVSIHEPMPFVYEGKPVDLSATKESTLNNTKRCTEKVSSICDEHGLVGFVMHPYDQNNPSTDNYRSLIHNLKNEIDENIKCKMLLENVKYFSSPERLKDVYNLGYELCFDVAHAQLLLGKEKLIETIVDMSPIIRYWHLADVRGEEHGFIVGQGVIDWCSISPFIRGHAVLEVRNEDELDPFEMAESLGYLRMMSVIDADVGMRRMLENEELQKILKKHNFELFDLL